MTLRRRRALLYTPGDDLHKIEKGAALDVDCVCMDLEDGVALSRKEAARATIVEALHSLDFGGSERLVRIQPLSCGAAEDDLRAVLPARPDGIVLPKADAEGLRWVSGWMDEEEAAQGLPMGSLALIAIAETARTMLHLEALCTATPRLQAVIFGGEDLAADLGAARTATMHELAFGRSWLVLHTAAFGLQALDVVYTNFRDAEGLRNEARQARELGYAGKQVIHPAQVAVVQEAFLPDEAEVAWARRVVEGFEQAQAEGRGAFAVDGRMVDMPVVRRAQAILARCR